MRLLAFLQLVIGALGALGASLTPFTGGLAHAASDLAAESRLVIDQVELQGVTVLKAPEIEPVLEIGTGDRYERVKVIRSAENIEALYRMRGYEQAQVKANIFRAPLPAGGSEVVLQLAVTEGAPTRIASVDFVPEEGAWKDAGFRSYWGRVQGKLRSRIGVAAGDVFDQEKVAGGKRAVQDALASEEYLNARGDDVRVTSVDSPDPGGAAAQDGARWVKLEFRISLGEKISFGFRGNRAFSNQELHAQVEEQRVLGLGTDYIGSIRSRILELYRGAGYASIKVAHYTFERSSRQERHITFEIDEGPRFSIGSVSFDGNVVFPAKQLKDEFFDRAPGLVRGGFFSEAEVQKAAELLIEWMKSRGYLSAKLITVRSEKKSFKKRSDAFARVDLTIYLYEGEQTIVRDVAIVGMQAFTEDQAWRTLRVKPGEPLNLFAFSEGIESFKAAYRAKGHLGVRVANEGSEQVVKYSHENRAADIYLLVAEGPKYRTSKVLVEGLGQTAEEVVRRELLIREEEFLEETRIADTEARLRKLGIFSNVSIQAQDDPQREGYKIVHVSVQEATPGILAGGVGFRNDLGLRVFGQTAYTNIGGKNHTVSLLANANRRFEPFRGKRYIEYEGQLSYLWPWFMWGDTTFRPALTVNRTQYFQFDAAAVSLSATLEKKLRPNLTAAFTYNLERVNQESDFKEVDNQTLTIGAVTPSLRLDLRDNPLAPTRGLFASASVELADPLLLSQGSQNKSGNSFPVGYWRALLRADYFLPVLRTSTLYLSVRTGFVRSNVAPVTDPDDPEPDPAKKRILEGYEGSGAVPLIKQFSLGGVGSVRGFAEQELNVQTLAIRGTLSYVNYRAQLDVPISGSLRFGPFLDAANLLVDRFSPGRLFFGTGLGFHYLTPVGPVNFDVGFKLNPRRGETAYNPDPATEQTFGTYFSIGIL